ncbi:MAG: DUF501 domain-containing protein [Halanaerobiaceae bacterium]|nr:DUF501 domain-containing protein [Halanaerobiaceae bacterium]
MATIEYQLGRPADNLLAVAVYCPFQKPAVLLTEPYSEEKGVFPTIYWLSCPYLVKEIARLEARGYVKSYSLLVKEDRDFRERLRTAHKKYAEKRMALLSGEKVEKLKAGSPAIYRVLKDSGVGGINNLEGIKCLHVHVADYLVNKENPIGEKVWDLLDWPEDCHICDGDRVREWQECLLEQ